jgi:hypothetical protein
MAFVEIVRVEKPVTVREADVMTLGEAAKILGIGLPEVKKLTDRNTEPLRLLVDTSEPNPTRNKRLLRDEVMAEKRRRAKR